MYLSDQISLVWKYLITLMSDWIYEHYGKQDLTVCEN